MPNYKKIERRVVVVFGKIISYSDGIDQVNEIILEVFSNGDNFINEISAEAKSNQVYHALAYEGINSDKPIGTGSLVIYDDCAYLKWIGVRKAYRKKLYGDMLIRMLVEKAKIMNCSDIFVDSPVGLKGMFENIGFLLVTDIANNEKMNILDSNIRMKYNKEHANLCQKTKVTGENSK